MMPINLYDTIRLRRLAEPEIRLECRMADGPMADEVPLAHAPDAAAGPPMQLSAASENLVYQAMQRMQQFVDRPVGFAATLIKRIPMAAGLGGGSSDAAATLVGCARLLGLKASVALQGLASELGSDVPFFLQPMAAWCRGRGERIEPVPGLVPLAVVVVKPPAGLATRDVYGQVELPDSPRQPRGLTEALASGLLATAGRLLFNRLQPAASRLCPSIRRIEQVFARLDVLGHQLSGSGTSYFGLCRNRRHAQRVAAQLRAARLGRVYAAETLGPSPP